MQTKHEILSRSRAAITAAYGDFLPYQIITWEGGETFYIWARYGTHNSYELKNTWEVPKAPQSIVQAYEEIDRYMSWEDNAVEMEEGAL
jgi:hypothetical protein